MRLGSIPSTTAALTYQVNTAYDHFVMLDSLTFGLQTVHIIGGHQSFCHMDPDVCQMGYDMSDMVVDG